MPTINNITITPGTGDRTVQLSISGTVNTGRGTRTGRFSLDGTGEYSSIHADNDLVVTQLGAAAFLSISPDGDVDNFPAAGGTLTYSGKSNMQSISIDSGSLNQLSMTATINGVPVTKSDLQNGYTVPGDPGLTAEYNVSFVYTIPANPSGATYTGKIGGNTYSVVQVGATPSNLEFSSETATVTSDGTLSGSTVSVIADTGLTWEITATSN